MTQKTQVKKSGQGNTRPALSRNRNWCFTLNNWTPEEKKAITKIANAEYAFQEEKGANGTPHLQGVIMFKNARTMSSVKRLIPRAHLEVMKGTKSQAVAYATKDDTRDGEISTNMDLTKMTHTTQIKENFSVRLRKKNEENGIFGIKLEDSTFHNLPEDFHQWVCEYGCLVGCKGHNDNQ